MAQQKLIQAKQIDIPSLEDVIDHGNLQDLGADDHTQYARADGSRTFDLDELEDVDINGSPTLTSSDILVWNGSLWRNEPNFDETAADAKYYTKTELDGTSGSVGAKIDKVSGTTVNAVTTMTAAGEVQDSLAAAPAALPRLPVVSTSDINLGTGAAALPPGTVAFVQGDGSPAVGSPAAFFVLAYVDGTSTWVRSDTLTAI